MESILPCVRILASIAMIARAVASTPSTSVPCRPPMRLADRRRLPVQRRGRWRLGSPTGTCTYLSGRLREPARAEPPSPPGPPPSSLHLANQAPLWSPLSPEIGGGDREPVRIARSATRD